MAALFATAAQLEVSVTILFLVATVPLVPVLASVHLQSLMQFAT